MLLNKGLYFKRGDVLNPAAQAEVDERGLAAVRASVMMRWSNITEV